jgi:hypothetical protein
MPAMRLTPLVVSLVLLSACARGEPVVLTEEERTLLAQISRDPYLTVVRIDRLDDGAAEVVTRQGEVEVRYRLAPAVAGGRDLRLRPVDERLDIPTEIPDEPGTGPVYRGHRR